MPSTEKKKETLEKSWLNYAMMHEAKPGKKYSAKQKKEMTAKRMAAAFMHARNVLGDGNQAPFSVEEARKTAAAISGTYAFQALTANEQDLDRLLASDVNELRSTTAQIYNPFGHLSFEEKKAMIVRLQQEILPEMAETEGRSEKYRSMVESIQNIDVRKLEDSADPLLNGDAALNAVLQNTEKYLKGKKSLRSKADEQARFDHGVDIMAVLGSGGGGAMMRFKGMVHRINEVRKNRKQPEIEASSYGFDSTAARHGEKLKHRIGKAILPEEIEAVPAKQKAEEKPLVREEKKNVNRQEEKEIAAPIEPAPKDPPKKKLVYEGNHINYSEAERFRESPERFEKIPEYPAEGTSFTWNSDEMVKIRLWNSLKDNVIVPIVGQQMLAAVMANHTTQMFRDPVTGKLGVDGDMYKENYEKYLKDPAVKLMAEKLKDPEARSELCNDDVNPTYEKIDPEKLMMTYMESKKEAAKNVGPTMGL